MDINESLIRLENSLQQIDSARKQVEKVVTNAGTLQETVAGYLDVLKGLNGAVSRLKDMIVEQNEQLSQDMAEANTQLNNNSKQIANNFKATASNTASKFATDTNQSLSILQEKIDDITGQISELAQLEQAYESATQTVSQLNEQITTLANEVDESQKQQDTVLATIERKVDTYNTNVNTNIGTITNLMTQLSGRVNSLQTSTNNISASVANLQTICQQIAQVLQTLTNSVSADYANLTNGLQGILAAQNNLASQITGLKETVESQILSNRKFSIIAAAILFVTVIVLHFI